LNREQESEATGARQWMKVKRGEEKQIGERNKSEKKKTEKETLLK